ncbi:MAG: helix-turn-helix transcriptional regulator [Burkholderiales bacterium]|nr:helix-turn-helix transcriptional regulator [Burkholderiales bacterium]
MSSDAGDFAAAAMLRVVVLGLARQGLSAPQALVAAPAARRSARIAFAHKRALAHALWQTHGALVLLRIGEAVLDMPAEPAFHALAPAADLPGMIERWQRLERFIHSRHRVRVLWTGTARLRLQHVSLEPGEPPGPGEHLLVFGLLVGLARRLGFADLRARFAGQADWLHANGVWNAGPWPAGDAALAMAGWELAWEQAAAPQQSAAGAQLQVGALAAARAVLAADPARRWTVARLAAATQRAPRSLQRELAHCNSGFTALLEEVRVTHAAQLLAAGQLAVVEIAYLSGFADQAHLTRVFGRATALSPAVYRAQFRKGSVAEPAQRG